MFFGGHGDDPKSQTPKIESSTLAPWWLGDWMKPFRPDVGSQAGKPCGFSEQWNDLGHWFVVSHHPRLIPNRKAQCKTQLTQILWLSPGRIIPSPKVSSWQYWRVYPWCLGPHPSLMQITNKSRLTPPFFSDDLYIFDSMTLLNFILLSHRWPVSRVYNLVTPQW